MSERMFIRRTPARATGEENIGAEFCYYIGPADLKMAVHVEVEWKAGTERPVVYIARGTDIKVVMCEGGG